jgi:hypothetical protein
MARISPKIGDIFLVKIGENEKKYFQIIAFDSTQLSSSVIRVFKNKYHINEDPNLLDIVGNEIDFYTHCSTKLGVKLNLWQKVGNNKNVGRIDNLIFRGTSDSGRKLGEKPVKISNKWYVWKINDKDFTRVGKLEGINKNSEIGLVVSPYDVIDRMKMGKFNFYYPDFE